ncbi:glycosyltransferase, partial [Anaerotignum lactatifermentans]
MATISLCMIVKDEELTLERCLQCAKGFADEIVVVDTGSVDRTKEIAEKYADVVCD